MAIKFGTDGTLYCNTVRYNYKQTRNLIADNCGDQVSNIYTMSNVSLLANSSGYKTYRSFQFSTGGLAMLSQPMTTPIAGHKYYGGLMWKTTGSSFSATDNRFEWYNSDTSNGTMVFANKNIATNGNWVKLSSIQTLRSVASGSWQLRNFLVNPTTTAYCCKMIIIDLTDAFGSGSEPSKEWCDNNILEWEKYVNFGTASGTINKTNYNTRFNSSGLTTFTSSNYLSLDNVVYPRDYLYYLRSNPLNAEGVITCTQNFSIVKGQTYYAFYEGCRDYNYLKSSGHNGETTQFYIPIAEPSMGAAPIVNNYLFSNGGSMRVWKRYGLMSIINNWDSGSYPFRIDFDNRNNDSNLWITNITLSTPNSTLTQYKAYNSGTSGVTMSDINIEWCHRWIAGRSTPIIHIKYPSKTAIKFNAPMQEMKKSSTSSYTKSQVDSYCGLTNDTWGGIVNANELHEGYAYINFILSDTNQPCRFLVSVKSVSGTTVTTDNYSWGASGSDIYELANGYDIQCNDIEIRPELNKIIFDGNTGTIKCKKLVKSSQF